MRRTHEQGWLYAVEAGRYVKIGFTRYGNLRQRLRSIDGVVPYEIGLLGLRRSFRSTEFRVHQALERWHVKGEWFESRPETLRVVNRLLPLKVEDAVGEPIGGNDRVLARVHC